MNNYEQKLMAELKQTIESLSSEEKSLFNDSLEAINNLLAQNGPIVLLALTYFGTCVSLQVEDQDEGK